MTILTADTSFKAMEAAPTYRDCLMKASTTIYSGSIVCYDTNGLAVAGVDTAGHYFAGYATEQVTSAATGNYYIRVQNGDIEAPATSITQAMVGEIMYVDDSGAFDDSAGVANYVIVGVLKRCISATLGVVDTTNSAILATVATASVFADGSTLVHEATLTAVNVDAAIEEFHAEFDDHICESGAGVTTVSPGTNREHFAGAVNGFGSGISYRVLDDGAGIAQFAVARTSGFTTGIPDVIQSVGTTGAQPAQFYMPAAIGAAAQGWGYKVYTQENCGVNTAGSAVGAPVYRSATGTLTLTRLTGTNYNQVVGRVLTLAANGEVQIDFDDEILIPHEHTNNSEGGEIGGVKSFIITETWVKDGADKAIASVPAFELPYAVTVSRCYGAVDTVTGGVGTLTVDLNTTLCCTFTAAAQQAEDEALAIAIAANTDWTIVLNETAGGACDNLKLDFYYTKDAV